MSTRSSASSCRSWSGDERVRQNIIDLDQFMHNAVRATRRLDSDSRREANGLVVDAGGVKHAVPAVGAGGAGAAGAAGAGAGAASLRRRYCSSSGSTPPPHAKRYSHDSGLSDGSSRHRKRRGHRRSGCEAGRKTPPPPQSRAAHSDATSNSMRAFRSLCERALCDQQVLIARVAELCERLAERPPPPPAPPPTRPRARSSSPRSSASDASSTTRTTPTRELARKDKHRAAEFKTYKIIMTKLDEMNRRLVSRSRHAASGTSGSVSVSDKVVSTEPALRQGSRDVVMVTNKCSLDIKPYAPQSKPVNMSTQSTLMSERNRSACVERSQRIMPDFDLEDPLHLYSQAVRLQALPLVDRELRSGESGQCVSDTMAVSASLGDHAGEPGRANSGGSTLCGWCRWYWKTFRQ